MNLDSVFINRASPLHNHLDATPLCNNVDRYSKTIELFRLRILLGFQESISLYHRNVYLSHHHHYLRRHRLFRPKCPASNIGDVVDTGVQAMTDMALVKGQKRSDITDNIDQCIHDGRARNEHVQFIGE